MKQLYVLELQYGKYYVGTTNNLQRRFQEHIDGPGSVWTQKYTPVAIERSVSAEGPLHEDRVTKELILKHGIDNVRGGSYCKVDLDDGQYESLTTELRSATGVCFKCGRTGHFAAVSWKTYVQKAREKETKRSMQDHVQERQRMFRCGRSGHFANSCYARTDVDGRLLSASDEDDSDEDDEEEDDSDD